VGFDSSRNGGFLARISYPRLFTMIEIFLWLNLPNEGVTTHTKSIQGDLPA
jgi:hypothetical protein